MALKFLHRKRQARRTELRRALRNQGYLYLNGLAAGVVATDTEWRIETTAFGDTGRTFLVGNPTPEQLEQQRQLWLEHKKQVKMALDRSAELLQRFITPKEWRDLNSQPGGRITIQGKVNRYWIGVNAIRRVDVGVWDPPGVFCVYPIDRSLPIWDRVLAFKLWLETREREFLSIANFTTHAGGGVNLGKLSIDGQLRNTPTMAQPEIWPQVYGQVRFEES